MRLLVIAILTSIFLGCHRDHNRLTILFDNVEGLIEDANVYYKGIVVGNVTKLALADKGVLVDIKLIDSLQIPEGSGFIINPSVFNGAHITIEPSTATTFITVHDTVIGHYQKKHLYDDFASDTASQRKVKESFEKIGEGIKGLIEASSKDTSKTSR